MRTTHRGGGARRVAPVSSVLLVLLLLVAGCGGGGQQQEEEAAQEEQQQGPVAGEFVGAIPEADTFLALVAEGGGGDAQEEVRAYLCDGEQLNEWFWGSVSGEELEPASDNGARLNARVSSEGASGTLTLSDGESFEFLAPPASGVEGFYPVNVTPEGQVSGTSWSGSQLEGSSSAERISGTITPPEGGAVDFRVSNPNIEEGEYRWIVLTEDDQPKIKGAKKGANSTGSTGGTRSPSIIVDYIDE